MAEAGAVWLTQGELVLSALGVLSQHLVVLLDPAAIVETMHDAYGRIDLAASPCGVLMAGPSATGDIEGVIIHGAQAARSLTVLLLRRARAEGRDREGKATCRSPAEARRSNDGCDDLESLRWQDLHSARRNNGTAPRTFEILIYKHAVTIASPSPPETRFTGSVYRTP